MCIHRNPPKNLLAQLTNESHLENQKGADRLNFDYSQGAEKADALSHIATSA
jgi:hypothetical protein